jgi:hypothetical protein
MTRIFGERRQKCGDTPESEPVSAQLWYTVSLPGTRCRARMTQRSLSRLAPGSKQGHAAVAGRVGTPFAPNMWEAPSCRIFPAGSETTKTPETG